MKILVADDDPVSGRMLEAMLGRWGYEPVSARDGLDAWERLKAAGAPRLAIVDWMMPGMDGVEVCRRVRGELAGDYVYIILLTSKAQKEDVIAGLEAGADDYVTKPFDQAELRSRLRTGQRILELEASLRQKVRELEESLSHVRRLQGFLPICMWCKKIRDEKQIWKQVEAYIEEHSGAQFTHALCDDCLAKHYGSVLENGVR